MSNKVETVSASNSSYPITKHVPPKFRVGGFQTNAKIEAYPRHDNILKQQVKVPRSWTQAGSGLSQDRMTKRKLEQKRMQAKHPHISYDLDGDGGVSARDFFIAKQFDKGNKGQLTIDERKEAQKAIKEGFTDKYVFGLERGGSTFLKNITEGQKRPTDRIIADHIRVRQ